MRFRFGDLVVAALAGPEFEIIRLHPSGAVAVAKVSIDLTAFPRLRVDALPEEAREGAPLEESAGEAQLASLRGDHDTCYELSVKRLAGGIEIQLAGDHRPQAGARYFMVFLWRAELKIVEGRLVVHGPFLQRDLDS